MKRIRTPLTKTTATGVALVLTAIGAAVVAIIDAITRAQCPPA